MWSLWSCFSCSLKATNGVIQTDSHSARSQSPSTLLSSFLTWFEVLLDLATLRFFFFFFWGRRQFYQLFDLFHFPKALHEIRSLLQPFLQCDWTCLRFIVVSCLVTWTLLSRVVGGVLNVEVLTLGPTWNITNTVWLKNWIILQSRALQYWLYLF